MKMRKKIPFYCSLVGVLLLFMSCDTLPEKDDKRAKNVGYKSALLKNLKKNPALEERGETISEEVVRSNEKNIGTNEIIGDTSTDLIEIKKTKKKKKQVAPQPFYEKFFKDGNGKDLSVELNFDATSILEVIDVFAGSLKFSYLMDPGVKGVVSIKIDKTQMSEKELWQLFERILWLSGAYCTYENGVVQILPFAMMPEERRLLIDHPQLANVEVALFHLHNAVSSEIAAQIKPFMTKAAQSINIQKKNSLLIVEAPSNMPKIRSLINMLDTNARNNWPKMAIYCMNVPASQIVEELSAIMPVLGYPLTIDKVTADAGAIHLTSADRLQVIVASAANSEALDEMKRWVNILDRDDTGEQERVFVYKVVNSTAEDLVKALSAIFTPGSSSSGSKSSSKIKRKKTGSAAKSLAALRNRPTSTKSGMGGEVISVFESPMKIFSDAIHQRLVIRTTPRTYAMMKALLMRLDTVPSQVLLQVTVAEVKLGDESEFGTEFGTQSQKGRYQRNSRTNWRDLTHYVDPNTGKVVENTYGFNYHIFNKNDPDKFAYLRALSSRNRTKVLLSPQIVAVSDKKATVKVGDRVPIVTKEFSNTESQGTISRDIQYQDTGIILNITPHITKGGLITLDLDQIVSDAVKTTSSDIDSPTIQERQMTTSLSIRDGATLIVGGLIWNKRVDFRNSLPIVADIPIVSSLIGYNEIKYTRVELLVLITVSVINERTDLQKKIARYRDSVKIIERSERYDN